MSNETMDIGTMALGQCEVGLIIEQLPMLVCVCGRHKG
jgi:hypothetical protein